MMVFRDAVIKALKLKPGLGGKIFPFNCNSLCRSLAFVKGSSMMVFPDVSMEILSAHFRGEGLRIPFTKTSLRNVLAQSGLIARPKKGRWARQVRGENRKRTQVWDFDLEGFKTRVVVE